jgi:hypothetical protein
MLRMNFGEFMEFFLKGLNPFKFKPISNWICFLDLYFTIHLEFGLLSKREVVPFEVIFHSTEFGNIWNHGSTFFLFFSLDQFELNWKIR